MNHRCLGWLGAIVAGALLVGCEGTTTTSTGVGGGQATLSVAAIDLGLADCGGEPPQPVAVTLTNEGDGRLRWSVAFESNAYFDLSGDRNGVLEPGAQTTITVTAPAMPTDVDAGFPMQGTLLVTTNDAVRGQIRIPVFATARGATFEVLTPSVADFGKVPVGLSAPGITVALRNTGNAPATVAIAAPIDPQFGFSWADGEDTEGVEVLPGEAMPGLRAQFEPATTNVAQSAGLVSVTGPVCGASAAVLNVRGQGLSGGVGISPAIVDFGTVDCGTQAEAQSFTIYNTGNQPYGWQATLEDGSRFTLSHTAGAVAASGATTVTVTAAPIGMTTNLAHNGFGDKVTLSSDVHGDGGTHEIEIHQTAYGAILKWASDDPLAFGEQPLFEATEGQTRSLLNEGTGPAEIVVTGAPFEVTPSTATVMPGATLAAEVAYKPDNFGEQTGALEISTASALCQPLPEGLPASGEGGKGAALAISVGGQQGPNRQQTPGWGGCIILEGSGGRIACFGTNEYGQLGSTNVSVGINVVPGLSGIVHTASGGDFNCAVDGDGGVWCWGNNRNGRDQSVGKLGFGVAAAVSVPTKVANVGNAVAVATGHNTACALIENGTVACWGSNRRGKLTGSEGGHNTPPVLVPNLTGITSLDIGAGGGCGRRNDGTVWCWGHYQRGELGNGSGCCGPSIATQVSALGDALEVTATEHSARGGARFALRADGTLVGWGNANFGILGNGQNGRGSQASTPTPVSGIDNAVSIASYHTGGCALINDGTIRCWGRNRYGEVGDGSTDAAFTPVTVSGITDATALAAGGQGACAIVTGGSVKCWGNYGTGTSLTPQTLRYF